MLLLKNCMRLATFDDEGNEYDGYDVPVEG